MPITAEVNIGSCFFQRASETTVCQKLTVVSIERDDKDQVTVYYRLPGDNPDDSRYFVIPQAVINQMVEDGD